MRALVTGAAGFVGQWLNRALLGRGWEVTGATNSPLPTPALLTAAERDAIRWVQGDVRDVTLIERLLEDGTPDVVFHLAAVSYVPAAGGDPGVACDVNVVAATRLLHEVARRRVAGTLDPVVLVVGSGEQYGLHDPAELPLTETAEQRPLTVYGATKAAQETMALQAFRTAGVRVICTRSFSHSGPGQDTRFLMPAIVRRALDLRGATRPRLGVGNLTPVRDYLHVEDVVCAYLQLVERGTPGDVYNVSSGVPVTVWEIIQLVLRRVDIDAEVVEDPALVRPVEVPALVGDSGKLRLTTGWSPRRTCDDIVGDLIHAATH